ncbi:hypothetical protein HK299_10590, partial [Streptococcus agalactiae]|nr:hypothetical protein [Streptococcus agalactiae]
MINNKLIEQTMLFLDVTNKLQTSQNKAAQLVGQRNQVVNKIQAILATVNYNSVNSIQEAEN